MSNKKEVITLFVLSLVIVGGYLLLAFSIDCWNSPGSLSNLLCSDFGETKAQPFFWSFVPILVTSFILLFVRRETFIAWAKFAVPAFVIMLAIIFYTYNNEPAVGGWVDWGSDDQLATLLLPSLFFIISLILVVVKSQKRSH